MSDNLYNANIQGDFNDLTIDGSGYGSLPAAEKNQTYFAYFNGVGGTGPEIIDQTAYFIKYLIDAQGNVVTPQVNSFALLNLNQNFEAGKTVNVTSLNGTTLFQTLLGNHTITDIGKIDTILTTETGSGRYDYITTMSFSQGGTSLQLATNPPNYTFSARKSGDTTVNSNIGWTDLILSTVNTNELGNYNSSTGTYTFTNPVGYSTNDYGIAVSFQASLATLFHQTYNNPQSENNSSIVYLRIVKAPASSPTSFTPLDIQIIPQPTPGNPDPNKQYFINENKECIIQSKFQTGLSYYANNISAYSNIKSSPQVFNNGDIIKIQYKVENASVDSYVYINGTPSSAGTVFTLSTNYNSLLQVTSSFLIPTNYPTSSHEVQGIVASPYLTAMLNPTNTFTQITPTGSSNFGFNNITSPSHIKPGDYIRFEYDRTKTSKIYNTYITTVGGKDYTVMEICPPIPSGSVFDHFCIFRVIPNGNYIILDVPKPSGTTGQPLTGFIKPQYVSKELEDNFENIIQKLASEGTIS